MTIFLTTFVFILVVMLVMSIGVIFGRKAIKGSCGGLNNGSCACVKKCEKRLKSEQSG
ncbi:MAG: (Na+)-NQR maturation NqrM [Gammaproteobacteria bacterium]|nr:(Na+)-NQR maturation NqrM [Gammaproteobacteria bacterium]